MNDGQRPKNPHYRNPHRTHRRRILLCLRRPAPAPAGGRRPQFSDGLGGMAGTVADNQHSDEAAYAQLSDDEQKAIGVETVQVKRQTIRREIAAPGKVVEPETGIDTIKARSSGRIDKLLINVTGGMVNRGDAVAQIYSPEVSTGDEYRLALRNRQRLTGTKAFRRSATPTSWSAPAANGWSNRD